MDSFKAGEVLVCDGYKGDGETRAFVVDEKRGVWTAKDGTQLLTAQCCRGGKTTFRTYHVRDLLNLRRSKV